MRPEASQARTSPPRYRAVEPSSGANVIPRRAHSGLAGLRPHLHSKPSPLNPSTLNAGVLRSAGRYTRWGASTVRGTSRPLSDSTPLPTAGTRSTKLDGPWAARKRAGEEREARERQQVTSARRCPPSLHRQVHQVP